MSNYTIEAILAMLREMERGQFYGEITLSYQKGKIAFTKITQIKKADEETLRKQKDVSLGLQI